MERYSILWWSIILPTSVVVGVPAFFLLGFLTDWGLLERVLVAMIATLAADLLIAALMEAVAPTSLHIGPGERAVKSDIPAEVATVISGFDASSHGKVSVRGETWMATRSCDEPGVLPEGMSVRVLGRKGLNLIVSSDTRWQNTFSSPGPSAHKNEADTKNQPCNLTG